MPSNLQVQRPDGEWMHVMLPHGYIAVLPGYTLERATCGLVKAPKHKVGTQAAMQQTKRERPPRRVQLLEGLLRIHAFWLFMLMCCLTVLCQTAFSQHGWCLCAVRKGFPSKANVLSCVTQF